jgi:ribosomal protein S27E
MNMTTIDEKECETDKCPIETNPNRGQAFYLKCVGCGHTEPITYLQQHSEACPKCKKAILIWKPLEKEVKKNEQQ